MIYQLYNSPIERLNNSTIKQINHIYFGQQWIKILFFNGRGLLAANLNVYQESDLPFIH